MTAQPLARVITGDLPVPPITWPRPGQAVHLRDLQALCDSLRAEVDVDFGHQVASRLEQLAAAIDAGAAVDIRGRYLSDSLWA